jgi:hypothetical protein
VRGFPVTSSCNSADDFSAARNAHSGVLVNDRDPLVARLAAAKRAVTSGADLPGLRRIYLHGPLGVSDEGCKWPNTLSCGLAGKGRYDRNTGGRESTIIEGSG